MSGLLSLFEGLLFRAPCEIVLLGHLIERVCSQTAIQNMRFPETHNV